MGWAAVATCQMEPPALMKEYTVNGSLLYKQLCYIKSAAEENGTAAHYAEAAIDIEPPQYRGWTNNYGP